MIIGHFSQIYLILIEAVLAFNSGINLILFCALSLQINYVYDWLALNLILN